jgi:hypothetical protein
METSVKIMLSYDYCHFEVSLSADLIGDLKQANDLRKECQRLADEAVRQYKKSKELAQKRIQRLNERDSLEREVNVIKGNIPKNEWSAEQKAKSKALEDEEYWSQFNYAYEDDEF